MNTYRALMMIGLVALAVCLASAQSAATDKPKTDVDRSNNGVESSIAGTAELPTAPTQAQPVSSYLYNQGGNVVLQNEAGSIYTRPDGRKVLVGAGGQTIVTGGDDSDEDDDDDTQSGFSGNYGNNIVINGRSVGGSSFISSNGGALVMNQAGEGGYQTYNNHQIRIVNGGLQLTTGGQVYDFPAKDASVSSQEKININGQEATVQYENGNIVVELADGTVLAKADGGLFSGDRNSYVNRKQIQEDAARQAAKVQEDIAQLQKELNERLNFQMRKLQEDLEHTLGNIHF
ncbi:uncharacterized protein [Drosophila virilis]|uniref:CG18067 protein n=1 Tax=Drosophila virilis TaxID=7244 RepID=B4LKZ1_DROVI|nr:uncharacterized protein LOC6626026 [Drosophila virilis]XP_032295808.1 uncharacterized protein LOC116652037 [Drosophila virilis]EDW60795.1 uncharacterized protein Dvir_GJ21687 [Drosophila virilis]